ncbi:multifunctional methyltransferase subunit TRM112-like protein isoform X1 [Rhineura floridana]|uniref:multifunctional methyltransferase subunit TRM112-like protein isoform X1 n=1 Tax=Rhineura floridana TaxID=261503 RepID=UPI002AC8278F|nr:multifunctional methyltransferase subunit TRM112-like protein isoform X1 [Rhineura floridana]
MCAASGCNRLQSYAPFRGVRPFDFSGLTTARACTRSNPVHAYLGVGLQSYADTQPKLCSEATEVKMNNVDFNPEFTARMIPKVEWGALVEAAESLGQRSDLPSEPIPNFESNEDFLRKVHHVLMEVEVMEGVLKCPDTGREFPITKGIPNMLLSEEET